MITLFFPVSGAGHHTSNSRSREGRAYGDAATWWIVHFCCLSRRFFICLEFIIEVISAGRPFLWRGTLCFMNHRCWKVFFSLSKVLMFMYAVKFSIKSIAVSFFKIPNIDRVLLFYCFPFCWFNQKTSFFILLILFLSFIPYLFLLLFFKISSFYSVYIYWILGGGLLFNSMLFYSFVFKSSLKGEFKSIKYISNSFCCNPLI